MAAEAAIDVLEKDIELPVLPKEVYELLPQFFTDVLNLEKREVHEADAAVFGLLPLFGAALSNTILKYRDSKTDSSVTLESVLRD